MRIIRQAALVPAPWKNGGGVTREALRSPPAGEPYGWRLSFAEVDVSGPFSDFSGYERFLVLVRGAGVRLEFGDGTAQTLRAVGNMARFDGGLATRGVLLQGPCADLNLIVARHGYRVRARVVELRGALAESPADGETALVVPLDAPLNVSCDAGEPFHLAPGDVAVGRYRGLASASPCRVFVAGITDNVP